MFDKLANQYSYIIEYVIIIYTHTEWHTIRAIITLSVNI